MERPTRYSIAVLAAELLPVPLLDTFVQNRLRRRLVRIEAERHGVPLPDDTIRAMADEPMLDPWRIVSWPVRKVLGSVLLPALALKTAHETKALADEARQGTLLEG
jgi:hypothetical protein